MEATVFYLDRTNSPRSSATATGGYFPRQMAQDGSALMLAATSFWAEYATAIASFHWMIVLTGFSPVLKKTRG